MLGCELRPTGQRRATGKDGVVAVCEHHRREMIKAQIAEGVDKMALADTSTLKPTSEWLRVRKKPVEVRAIRTSTSRSIHTLEGTMIAAPGDWIIQGIKGELYPCKPDIFEATYEILT